MSILPNSTEQEINLPESFVDIDGNPIHEHTAYAFYVLSVADSINKDISILSNRSNPFVLSNPNYLKAGQTTGSGMHYTELDILASRYGHPTTPYSIDVNNDNVEDFQFKTGGHSNKNPSYDSKNWSYSYYYKVIPLNNNRVLVTKNNHPTPLYYHYIIKPQAYWSSSPEDFYYYYENSNTYVNESGIWEHVHNSYMGIQIITETDTLFGWIGVRLSYYQYPWGDLNLGFKFNGYAYQSISENIEEKSSNSDISVYPNPAKDYVSVEINNNLHNIRSTVNFTSLSGALSKTAIIDGKQTNILLTDLSPGVYLIEIENENFRHTEKIVVLP